MEKPTETEKAPVSSTQEQTGQPSERVSPKSLRDAFSSFEVEQAREAERPAAEPSKAKEEVQDKGKVEKEPCPECEESQDKGEEGGTETPLYILDKDGNKHPLRFKADGKEYVPDSVEKLMTWAGLGVHANAKLQEVNQAAELMKTMFEAIQQGKITIPQAQKALQGSEEPEAQEGDAEELAVLDPDLKREIERRRTLEKKLATIEKEHSSLKAFVAGRLFKEEKQAIDSDIEKHKKTYFLSTDSPSQVKRIWGLLKEVDEKTGAPTYTVEAAMKKIHEEEIGRFKRFIKEHPEHQDKDAIISAFLKEREEKEAPVAAPSGQPAGGAPVGKDRPKFKNLRESIDAANVWLDEQRRAGKLA